MKRFVAVLAGLLTLPAFAEDAIIYKEDGVRSDVVSRNIDVPASATAAGRTSGRSGAASRGAISRVVPAAASDMTTANRNAASGRVIAAGRAGVAAPSVSARKAAARDGAVVSRTAVGQVGAKPAVAARVAAPSAPRVRARAATMTTNVSKGDNVVSVNNSSDAPAEAAATPASVTAAMENSAALTSFCKAQYTECMDNFCNVLDDNQGRCSCSKNIKNYEKTENALKAATESLQDVAQQIQYIGLSKDEIETLFSQTEAEIQMQATSDNSQIKNDLDKIKGLIVQVKSGTASSTEIDTGLSMDLSGLMNFNISSAGFDLGSLFGTQTANTGSISNQRGEQLYKTAAARCKTAVLNDCQSQGVDISIVSNAYDMEIDKQCVAYERSLTDANEEMVQTVRNAKSVLQRARLMVAQQKNAYDLRGCVNALDACMQDDFVCGNDYENCLDPSGKYIVDGEVVVGSMPGQTDLSDYSGMSGAMYSADGLYSTWNYGSSKNAWGASSGYAEGSLNEYVTSTMGATPTGVGDTMSEYLQYKIGYIKDNKSYGMCASVLNKCQDYTYSNGSYSPKNRVVEEYLMRTLVKIKNAQDNVLADYAETCIADVSSCLGENNYDETATNSSKSKIAINACRSQIITCMSVNGRADADPTPAGMAGWVSSIMTETGGVGGGGVTNCASGGSNCYITTHLNASGQPTCSGLEAYSVLEAGGICPPTGTSCAAVGGIWSNNTCYCTGSWKVSPNSQQGYTGYKCS
ncbi:MAG: hypothetical protein J6R52_01410 [Alphaproteobacteria bacterium]|nr:hypothetical protein [Alphaproteobacteria bacterium]